MRSKVKNFRINKNRLLYIHTKFIQKKPVFPTNPNPGRVDIIIEKPVFPTIQTPEGLILL